MANNESGIPVYHTAKAFTMSVEMWQELRQAVELHGKAKDEELAKLETEAMHLVRKFREYLGK